MSDATARPISARKRAAVVTAAKESFLARGFAATNLDDVARAAGVSKMTIYSHFDSKENLFTDVLTTVVTERSSRGPALDADVDAPMLRQALTAVAVDIIETVQDPEIVGLRRVLIAEQPRHPAPASAWRRGTVLATVGALADHFAILERRGLLVDVDPTALASQFLWMLIGDPLDAMLLDPEAEQVSPQVRAAGVVRIVLAAHQRPSREGA
jgi:TetR/AcrR family transcriptional repressor of mexJK operon